MNDCVFCQIVAKTVPADVVFENEHFLAFLNIKLVAPGHTLLIPKAHHPHLTETPDDTVGPIFIVAKQLMTKIKQALAADLVALMVVGIEVAHLHIHLIPRRHSDDLANFWPEHPSTAEERKVIAAKIKEIKNKIHG